MSCTSSSLWQRLGGVAVKSCAQWSRACAHRGPALTAPLHHLYQYSTTTSQDAAGSSGDTPPSAAQQGELHVTVEPLADAHEGVSVVTLCRPAARNAIGRQLLRELSEAVNLLRQERTTRCVLLRSGVQGVFCSGADLKERAGMTQAETVEFVTSLRRALCDLEVRGSTC